MYGGALINHQKDMCQTFQTYEQKLEIYGVWWNKKTFR